MHKGKKTYKGIYNFCSSPVSLKYFESVDVQDSHDLFFLNLCGL
jgi:hypothetical protein